MKQQLRAASAAVAFAYHRRCDVIGVYERETKRATRLVLPYAENKWTDTTTTVNARSAVCYRTYITTARNRLGY
ncbi:hypothetical protein [Bradyrhizobium australafricanum]|uniref:hypothetical protein n=1 Tax=Bradyrhizobium australafricanum TaxID=2821406 RepID=UPI001CE26479|nr:hypothetical protein [Bradyrhizobium australafricanum]MCA6100062.1 hypothetical protein [Bradyrhizobium australafricanum]